MPSPVSFCVLLIKLPCRCNVSGVANHCVTFGPSLQIALRLGQQCAHVYTAKAKVHCQTLSCLKLAAANSLHALLH